MNCSKCGQPLPHMDPINLDHPMGMMIKINYTTISYYVLASQITETGISGDFFVRLPSGQYKFIGQDGNLGCFSWRDITEINVTAFME